MRSVVLSGILVASLFFAHSATGTDAPAAKKTPPQAEPVVIWIKASKTADVELLKTAFSERMRKQHEKNGWEQIAKNYKDIFANLFGDYQVEEFSFEFEGDDKLGKVKIVHPKKTTPGVAVILEGGTWKVDEK